MIKNLILKNFRNFSDSSFLFEKNFNFIIWENGLGKTNILEAISILTGNPISEIDFQNLVKFQEKSLFISWIFEKNIASISYLKEENKKTYLLQTKKTTKKNLIENTSKSIIFSPWSMNIFYLWPKYRRKFLDDILQNNFWNYKKIYKNFKNILKKRNKILKAIKEEKAEKKDIIFWNKNFIEESIKIYKYRKNLINFYKKNINNLKKYFLNKEVKIKFEYISKINLENKELNNDNFEKIIYNELEKYLKKNLDLEILLTRTTIWPHLDDFDLKINDYKIIDFASRWEIKSSILGLKFIEIDYLIKNTWKKPIILIDDFLSEIDDKHKDLLLANIKDFQSIITSISELKNECFFNANKIFVK